MSWAVGYDLKWQRDIGYDVPAYCDQPGCGLVIDRGLSYVCGGKPKGGDRGCGLYFWGIISLTPALLFLAFYAAPADSYTGIFSPPSSWPLSISFIAPFRIRGKGGPHPVWGVVIGLAICAALTLARYWPFS